MSISKEELKKRACQAIDNNQNEIIALGDAIFAEPELGYKEFKAAERVKKLFEKLGFDYEDEVAITGVIAPVKGKESKLRVAIMGELDAVVCPDHPHADKATGAAHSCGHNCMVASLAGVAYALSGTGIMEELSGDIVLMAVPAEEYVELEYRKQLKEEGKIYFFGGKQEFIRLGYMDDIDIMMMQHSYVPDETTAKASAGLSSKGFVGKLVRYTGKEVNPGVAPWKGINALSAARIAFCGIDCLRETFREKDGIRVHPIITKGGDLVNVTPADVRVELYVRGNNVPALMDISKKVDGCFVAGGQVMGAGVEITTIPGYMPRYICKDLLDLVYDNIKEVVGAEYAVMDIEDAATGSSDAGDISHLMPTTHSYFMGVTGVGHSKDYVIEDKYLSYIAPAKVLVMSAIDLLYNGAEKGLEVKGRFVPPMTKEEYLREWGKLEV